jgi:hypothetical protein
MAQNQQLSLLGQYLTVNSSSNVVSINTASVNAVSYTIGTTLTANATLVNAAAINITGQTNTATLYVTTSANVGTYFTVNSSAVVEAVNASFTGANLYVTGTNTYITANTLLGGLLTTTSNTVTFGTATYFVANGNVGIGTSTPAQKLEVYSSTTNLGRIRVTGSTTTSGNFRGFELANSSGFTGGFFQDESSNDLTFWTSAERMRINSVGNVGIGNSAPVDRLSVNGTTFHSGNVLLGSSSITVGLQANGGYGTSGQVLTSNGTATYWAAASSSGQYTPRVSSTASASSVTPTTASYDLYVFTALAATLTINASTFLPTNGTKLMFRIKDNGTAQTLTWTTTGSGSFRILGTTLPTTTTANKVTYVGCVYNSDESYWDVIAVGTQA